MKRSHRLFFALEPGNQVRKAVHAVQLGLGVEGRAVSPDQFHLTLAFLGQQAGPAVPVLKKIAAALNLVPCTIVLDRTGNFRGTSVLWLGASDVPGSLLTFRQSLVEALTESGISHDHKDWKLHLTVYRRLRKQAGRIETVPVYWPLNGFSLIESVSCKNGVEYRRLGQWKSRSSLK